mgnify:CR=1 FL=1
MSEIFRNFRRQSGRICHYRSVHPHADHGIQSGLIIGISLIVTVFGSFLFLETMDGTMQRVSLAAFVLAMGDACRQCHRHRRRHPGRPESREKQNGSHDGIGRQTSMPLLGATLIAIIAFLPIFMSPDTAGVYTRDLFIVLAVSLLLSWVLALVHVYAERVFIRK